MNKVIFNKQQILSELNEKGLFAVSHWSYTGVVLGFVKGHYPDAMVVEHFPKSYIVVSSSGIESARNMINQELASLTNEISILHDKIVKLEESLSGINEKDM